MIDCICVYILERERERCILTYSHLQSFNPSTFIQSWIIPQSRSSSSDEKKSLEVRTLFLEKQI